MSYICRHCNFDENHEKYEEGLEYCPLCGLSLQEDVVLVLEKEDLLMFDPYTWNIKVGKDIFGDFVAGHCIDVRFTDSQYVLLYIMKSEDEDGIYMEYLEG